VPRLRLPVSSLPQPRISGLAGDQPAGLHVGRGTFDRVQGCEELCRHYRHRDLLPRRADPLLFRTDTGVEWRDQDLVAIITRYRRGNGKVTVVEQNGVWANLRAPKELLLRYRGSNGPERVPVDVSVREALGLCPGCSNIGP